jgi:hypothetical protein
MHSTCCTSLKSIIDMNSLEDTDRLLSDIPSLHSVFFFPFFQTPCNALHPLAPAYQDGIPQGGGCHGAEVSAGPASGVHVG